MVTADCAPARAADNNTLRFAGYGAPLGATEKGTLNPFRTFHHLYYNLQHQIFETLVAVDLNTQTIVPVLAEKWQKISDKTVRFHLRRGVRFHNNEPFNAEAVRFSIEMLKDPRNRFPMRFLLDSIARVECIDDFTVDIITHYPDALLLRTLASIGYILPPDYYRRVGDDYFTRYPVGTGPFRYYYTDKSPEGYKQIHFVANEDYWHPARPSLHELVCCFIPGPLQWKALENGAVDMVITQYTAPGTALQKKGTHKIVVQKTLRQSVCLLNVDKEGPLADIRVRQAIQHAVNRDAIINDALGGYGNPLFSSAPEGALGHNPEPVLYEEDLLRARELLSDAGYPDGCSIDVMANSDKHTIEIVTVLKRLLGRVGINVNTFFFDGKEIVKKIIEPKLNGSFTPSTFDMGVLTGWPSFRGTGARFSLLFLSSHGIFNFGANIKKENPVDAMLIDAAGSTTREQFIEKLHKLDRYILEQSLIVPLYQVEVMYGMKKNVHYAPGLNDLPHGFWRCFMTDNE